MQINKTRKALKQTSQLLFFCSFHKSCRIEKIHHTNIDDIIIDMLELLLLSSCTTLSNVLDWLTWPRDSFYLGKLVYSGVCLMTVQGCHLSHAIYCHTGFVLALFFYKLETKPYDWFIWSSSLYKLCTVLKKKRNNSWLLSFITLFFLFYFCLLIYKDNANLSHGSLMHGLRYF